MPGIVRKFLIYAAVDGLVLQPFAQRGQRPQTAVTIDYKSHTVRPLLSSSEGQQDKDKQLESYGVIGEHSFVQIDLYLTDMLLRPPQSI